MERGGTPRYLRGEVIECERGAIYLWDAASGAAIGGPTEAHGDAVIDLNFSPDGATLMSVGADGAVLLFATQGGLHDERGLEEATGAAQAASFSRDGLAIATIGGVGDGILAAETELRLWAGEPPFERADPVGPTPAQGVDVPILAGAMGPKAMARAAQWADGESGFSVSGTVAEMAANFRLAEQAWTDAGRTTPPRRISGCFYVLDDDDERAAATLDAFARRYLAIFGTQIAEAMAATCRVASVTALHEVLDGAADAGCDELVLVPGTVDLDCLHRTSEALTAR